MKKIPYLHYGLIWLMASAVSIVNFIQTTEPGNLTRGGLFLAFSIFYFWMNGKQKQQRGK